MNIDWTRPEQVDDIEEGHYRVEVKHAEEKLSRNGDPQFVLELVEYESSTTLCKDWLTNSKTGWGSMKGKLKCLGVEGEPSTVEAADLIGKQAVVALKYEESEAEGRDGKVRKYRNLKIDFGGGGHNGYWPVDDPETPKTKSVLPF